MTTQTTLPKLTLIKAGAGSGKTFGIQQTLSDWVLKNGLKPEQILAVTFTNAGAAEMRERIRANLLKNGGENINLADIDKAKITTIHGFGLSLVERFAYKLGLSPKPRQLNEAEQTQLIKHATAQLAKTIEQVTKNLDLYGYTGGMQGDKFVSKTDQFRNDVLRIIERLRGLGKGTQSNNENIAEAKRLIAAAQQKIDDLYGEVSSQSETELNQALLDATQALKAQFANAEELNDVVGTKAFNTFSNAVFAVNAEKISTDWKLWVKLQEDEGLSKKSYEKIDAHPAAQYFYQVWQAAAKLTQHPGPLRQAKEHTALLLQAAFDALQAYQTGKAHAGLVDFTDMVQLAQQIIANDECFNELKEEVGCLVIDEFQDTNPLQFSLLHRFQQAGIPTYIVGDLKQSIMGFQGADSRLLSSLWKNTEAKDGQIIKKELDENWRSSTKIMVFVNQMGNVLYPGEYQELEPQAEKEKRYKKESAFAQPVCRIIFDQATDKWTQAAFKDIGYDYVINEIHQLVQSEQIIIDKHTGEPRPIKYSDIAVLATKHKRLQEFAEKLRKAGLAAHLAEDDWYESASVQLLLNALQYLNNSSDHYAALSLITNSLINADLQQSLNGYYDNKRFTHDALNSIGELKQWGDDEAPLQYRTIKDQLISLTIALKLDEKAKQLEEGGQLKANAAKLVSLAGSFAQMPDSSLQAMGIHGKNSQTFCTWIQMLAEDDNRQPATENQSQDAVVLKTWHGSKGLEWSVVIVLDAHEERKPKLAHTGISYTSDDIEEMLTTGTVDFLPDMVDPSTQKSFLATLEEAAQNDQKNLIYVALTRAREQIILPWYKSKDGYKDNSLCAYLDGLFTDDLKAKTDKVITQKDGELFEPLRLDKSLKQKQLKLEAQRLAAPLAASIAPSQQLEGEEQTSQTNEQQHNYGAGIDFSELEKQGLQANEIGTWMHRLYHVFLKQPQRLEDAMQLFPKEDITLSAELKQSVMNALKAFNTWLKNELKAKDYHCELPILATNDQGQTISGTIDLLVETEQGYWIIDHKTDQQSDFAKHQQQLMAYVRALKLEKPVLGVAVNWVRENEVVQIKIRGNIQ